MTADTAAAFSWPSEGAPVEAHLDAMHLAVVALVRGPHQAVKLHRHEHAGGMGGDPPHRHITEVYEHAHSGPLLGSGMAMLPYLTTSELDHLEAALLAYPRHRGVEPMGLPERSMHLSLLTAVREARMHAQGPR